MFFRDMEQAATAQGPFPPLQRCAKLFNIVSVGVGGSTEGWVKLRKMRHSEPGL